MESVKIVKENNFCHDCGKKIEIKGENIENGLQLFYDDQGKKISIFKCTDCYSQNKSLNNFKECEVYSRIVGYLRPVSQWNKGKKQEYNKRKEYLLENMKI